MGRPSLVKPTVTSRLLVILGITQSTGIVIGPYRWPLATSYSSFSELLPSKSTQTARLIIWRWIFAFRIITLTTTDILLRLSTHYFTMRLSELWNTSFCSFIALCISQLPFVTRGFVTSECNGVVLDLTLFACLSYLLLVQRLLQRCAQ